MKTPGYGDEQGAVVVRRPGEALDLPEQSWQALADDMGREPGLLPLPPAVLRAQVVAGTAAIATAGARIVSHVSRVALLDDTIRETLGLGPGPEVGVFMSGWTHPDWRRRSLSRRLREVLCESYAGLLVSRTFGLGASVVLCRMGFVLRDTDALPYLLSLMGWPTPEGHYQVRTGTTGWSHLRTYTGPHRSPLDRDGHDWGGFIHLWVSDAALADAVEAELAQTGPLSAWRDLLRFDLQISA